MTKARKSVEDVPPIEELVASCREQLHGHGAAAFTNHDIERFVRAAKFNVEEGARRARDTWEWRVAEGVDARCCSCCPVVGRQERPADHYMHPVAFDLKDRPVIYSCHSLATNRKVPDNKDHIIQTFEETVALLPEGRGAWVWILDFKGFGHPRDLNPALAKVFLSLAERHYPERLAHFILLDAPTVFSTLWAAIRPLVDPHTKKKINFFKTSSKELHAHLATLFDASTIEWLETEVAQNRSKKLTAEKLGRYPGLGAAAPCLVDGHDIRGAPNFLAKVEALAGTHPRLPGACGARPASPPTVHHDRGSALEDSAPTPRAGSDPMKWPGKEDAIREEEELAGRESSFGTALDLEDLPSDVARIFEDAEEGVGAAEGLAEGLAGAAKAAGGAAAPAAKRRGGFRRIFCMA